MLALKGRDKTLVHALVAPFQGLNPSFAAIPRALPLGDVISLSRLKYARTNKPVPEKDRYNRHATGNGNRHRNDRSRVSHHAASTVPTLNRLADAGLDPARLPDHIAVIMDGNGRWARQRGKQRVEGHFQGVTSVRTTVEECCRLGVGHLTLYCLSSENWKRPAQELSFLMALLESNT